MLVRACSRGFSSDRQSTCCNMPADLLVSLHSGSSRLVPLLLSCVLPYALVSAACSAKYHCRSDACCHTAAVVFGASGVPCGATAALWRAGTPVRRAHARPIRHAGRLRRGARSAQPQHGRRRLRRRAVWSYLLAICADPGSYLRVSAVDMIENKTKTSGFVTTIP